MMKKYFSNIFALAALLMAGAAFTACSSDDNIDQPANPVGEKTYTLTVNATKDVSAATRALNLDGAKLVASWAEGDELNVFKAENRTGCTAGNLLGTISPVAGSISADGAKATFTGTLTGTVSDGDKLMLVYHPAAFAITGFEGQAGTLASASNLDCATALVTASVSGSDITISETSATFTTHTAMLKLTLTTDGTTTINPTSLKMSMSAGGTPLYEFTFTPTAATYTANGDGVFYCALPSAADVAAGLSTTTDALAAATITYAATVGSDTYTATKTGYTFAAGKYYAGTLTMKKQLTYPIALSAVTSGYVGSVVTADGYVYPAKTAVPAGKTAVGILGKVTATGHGLILALKDAATQQKLRIINDWTSVDTYAGTTLKQLPAGARGSSLTSYTTLGSTTVSDWCVAQKSDYEAIFINLGSINLGEDEYYSNGYTYDDNVNAYITTGVGGTAISGNARWSATESVAGSKGWIFGGQGWNPNSNIGTERSLRPVLGF